ncbi:MAG: response regulator [Anaerolineae bacterium]|nr:response regulator [Anaerolineae bacterium]
MAGTRKKVMCVEDNSVNMLLVSRIVEAEGHELVQAADGYVARDILQELVPDIILLDINLPGVSGLELAKEFKSDPRLAPVPLIATTAQVLVGG